MIYNLKKYAIFRASLPPPCTLHIQTVLFSLPHLHVLLRRRVHLPSERPDAPVSTRDIAGVEVVKIPPQAPEDVLAGLQQDVHFAAGLLDDPLAVALHVPLGVARADDRTLCLEQLRQRVGPLGAARRVAQARVEEHEDVEVGVVGRKVARFVHGVEVVHKGGDLHAAADAWLDEAAERVDGCAFGEREFGFAVGHRLRSDEDDVEGRAGEAVCQLYPNFARE